MDFRLQNWYLLLNPQRMGEALSMGWCLAIMQKALLWTTVCNIFGKNHAPTTLTTSFVDLEIEFVTAAKKLNFRPLQLSILFQFQSNVIDSVDPHLPSFPCNFILNLFSFWILLNKRYIIPRGNKNGHTRRIKQKNTTT